MCSCESVICEETHGDRCVQRVDLGLNAEQELDVGVGQDGVGFLVAVARQRADDELLNAVERTEGRLPVMEQETFSTSARALSCFGILPPRGPFMASCLCC